MKLSICWLISSRICTVTRFFDERRAGDLHQLALVEVAGDEQEVDEEEDHRELAEKSQEADAAHPEIVGGPERRLDDLHALHRAFRARSRLLGAWSRRPPSSRSPWRPAWTCCERLAVLPLVCRDAVAHAPRRFRDVGDDGERFVAEGVDAEADGADEERRPPAPRQPRAAMMARERATSGLSANSEAARGRSG